VIKEMTIRNIVIPKMIKINNKEEITIEEIKLDEIIIDVTTTYEFVMRVIHKILEETSNDEKTINKNIDNIYNMFEYLTKYKLISIKEKIKLQLSSYDENDKNIIEQNIQLQNYIIHYIIRNEKEYFKSEYFENDEHI
jgi:hypothetical protein